MRRCEYVKMFDAPPLFGEPFAQTLLGKSAFLFCNPCNLRACVVWFGLPPSTTCFYCKRVQVCLPDTQDQITLGIARLSDINSDIARFSGM